MTYKVYEVPSSEPILTLFFGIFFWWISNEILSRLFGFKNNIYQTKTLKGYDEKMEQNTDANENGDGNSPDTGSSTNIEMERLGSNSPDTGSSINMEMERLGSNSRVNSTKRTITPLPTLKLHQRMSKSLDVNNKYRAKINPVQWYLKAFFHLIILVIAVIVFIIDPDWHYDVYIAMNHSSNNYVNAQHVAAIIVSFYIWENIIITKYGKCQISGHIHHWLAALAGILIIIGVFNPFAMLYAEIGIGLAFMLPLSIAIRAHLSKKYPRFVRKVCQFSQYYYGFVTIMNCIGQILLMINGQITQSISILHAIIVSIGIIGCVYDDIQSIKALHEYSGQTYQYLLW